MNIYRREKIYENNKKETTVDIFCQVRVSNYIYATVTTKFSSSHIFECRIFMKLKLNAYKIY